MIENFLDSLGRHENSYLDSKIQLEADILEFDLSQLFSVVRETFFTVPAGHLKFYPDKIDSRVYDTNWKKIVQKTEKVWRSYVSYRKTVKEKLQI